MNHTKINTMDNKTLLQKDILKSLPKNPHGLLLLAPRLGKTYLAIQLIKRDKYKKVLWVTPNTKLRDEDIPNEFIHWDCENLLKNITIICYASLSKHRGNYDCVILDEYQDISIQNSIPLIQKLIKYNNIIGLSGTHPNHYEKNLIFQKLNLRVLKTISIEEAVDKKVIAPYKITTIGVKLNSTDKDVLSGNKNKSFYQTEFQKYNYLTSKVEEAKLSGNNIKMRQSALQRMFFIHNLKSKRDFAKKLIKSLKGRTLIFCSNINQAEEVCENTFHSKTNNKKLDDFINNKINTLACVNAGGTGFTYKNVDNLILIQCDSNNKGNTVQKIARSLVLQEGYTANIYILYSKNTVDEEWVNRSLKDFDNDKIVRT